MSGLSVGKVVFSILSGDTTIRSLVDNKIYPIFAPDEIINPFIVFQRNEVSATYTKDGLIYDDITIVINAVSDDYSECVSIAEAIRVALEFNSGVFNGINIHRILFAGASEDFGVDGFITTLQFTFRCK